jgi:NADH dehydrogenase FAD-containing subunit
MTAVTPYPLRVLIAGGGSGALETAQALHALAGAGVDIELLAPDRHFARRSTSLAEPTGTASATRRELAEIARENGFGLVRDAVERVDADSHRVTTQDGSELEYNVLVLAVGARPRLTVPGAFCFRGPQDMPALRRDLLALAPGARVGYVVDARAAWPLPAYELALTTEQWSRSEHRGLEVVLITSELSPLAMFGASAGERISAVFEERGIELLTGRRADRFADEALHVEWDRPIPLTAAIALPALTGPAVPGIPRDALGFAPVDEQGRVDGVSDVYAVGDMAERPGELAGSAARQGAVVAAAIATQLGAEPSPPQEGDDQLAPLWAIMSA